MYSSILFATRHYEEGVSTTLLSHFLRGRPVAQGTGGWVGLALGWTARKISTPPVFDSRTVQPVTSRYTDYAIPIISISKLIIKL